MKRIVSILFVLIFLLSVHFVSANNIGLTTVKAKLSGNYTLQQKEEILSVLKNRLKSYAGKEAGVKIEGDSIFVMIAVEIDSIVCVDLLTKKGEFEITELYPSTTAFPILSKANDLLKTNQFKGIRKQIYPESDALIKIIRDDDSFENQPLYHVLIPNDPGLPYGEAVIAYAKKKDYNLLADIFSNPKIKSFLPKASHLAWSSEPDRSLPDHYSIYLVKDTPIITNDAIETVGVDYDSYGYMVVSLQFKNEYHKVWEKLTAENVSRQLPVMIDGEVLMAPTVVEAITGGKIMISGNLDHFESRALAAILNTKQLNATIEVVEVKHEYPPMHYLLKMFKKLK